jgi:hypothetical protein
VDLLPLIFVRDMVKRQHLFNSFWLSLATAVLSTQPAWADSMQVSAVRLNPKVSRIQEKPAPTYLNPSPNPFQFPSLPESVQIQRTQPITLQQAAELAQRNNRSLQTSQLSLERSRAALQEATTAEYPTLGTSADITRSSVR